MPFQRSKSAPNSIATINTLHILRSSSHENVQPKPRRSATAIRPGMTDSHVVSSSVLSPTSRLDKDDPFSLTSFFPTSRISEEEERWSWLRTEEEHELTEEPIADEDSYGNEAAGEVIKSEDKLGVLSLNTLFAARGSEDLPMNDRLFSPYSDEDVVDVDSLYLALYQRRRRDTQRGAVDAKPAIGGLFLPASTEPVTDVNSLRSFVDGFRKFL